MENFIEKVNAVLQEKLAYCETQIHGIAEPLLIKETEEDIVMLVINVNGECYSVLHDDSKTITSYHRLTSKAYNITPNGFGDSKTIQEVYNFNLIVVGSREEFDQYEMETICARTLIECADKYNVVVIAQSTFDAQSIFQAEYSGVRYTLPPNIFCFKISYKLTRTQNPCHK